jgi:hypothetical protein
METEKETKGQFDEFATDVIRPIMQAMFKAAFECLSYCREDSDEEELVPYAVKEGVLETLDDIIEHCGSQAGWADAASLFGFAAGRDGMKPGREFRRMEGITKALRDLIQAKKDQIQGELADMKEQEKRAKLAAIADKLGFR